MRYRNKVLVTGGHGFLGRRIIELLKYREYEVFAPSISEYNLVDKNQVCAMFHSFYPDYIINAAARVGGIMQNTERPAQFFYDNAAIGMNVIEEAMHHEVHKFVQIGSACAYPAEAAMPLREDQIWNGYPELSNAAYGIAKRMLLEMLRAYRTQYGLNGIYLIPTNLYGPGDHSHHVIPDTIQKIRRAKEWHYPVINAWGTGEVTRDFLFVEDAAYGVVHMMESQSDYSVGAAVNLGSGMEYRLKALIGLIAELMDYQGEISFDGREELNGQTRRVLDTSRAKKLGWTATTGIRAGLERTIAGV